MDLALLTALNNYRANRIGVIRVAALDGSFERLVTDQEDISADPLARDLAACFKSGKSGLVTPNTDTSTALAERSSDVFLTVYLPPPKLIAIGAVHISQALVKVAKVAGFHITIVDPRTAFATPERFADVPLHADWPEDILPDLKVDRYTALAALTHDPKIDDWALAHALARDCFYVGALGSRKTHGKRLQRLEEAGVSATALQRIKAPIGLDIGAANPQEIAVAILAEIIATLRIKTPQQ